MALLLSYYFNFPYSPFLVFFLPLLSYNLFFSFHSFAHPPPPSADLQSIKFNNQQTYMSLLRSLFPTIEEGALKADLDDAAHILT